MKGKILLVDDSKVLQVMFRRFLEKAGFQIVACADDGIQGLNEYRNHLPDIVLMDVTMPNMSGKECLEEIMKINTDAVIVMISGLADPQIESDCLRLGAKAFVSKSDITDMGALEHKVVQIVSELVKEKNSVKAAS